MVEANVKIIEELKLFLSIVIEDPEMRKLFTQQQGDFSRDRKMPMEKVISMLINLPKRSLCIELQEFFENIAQPELSCTKGAFCLQRIKLKAMFFHIWNQCLVDSFYRYYGDSVKRWRGFRIFAVDGSTCYLFNKQEVLNHFGSQDNQHGEVPMGRIMQIHDVLNDLTICGNITPFNKGEQALMAEQVIKLPSDSLTLFDRGYTSYALMYLMNNQETPRHFLIRSKLDFNNEVKSFMRSCKSSKIVTLTPGSKAIAELKRCGYIIATNHPLKVRMVKIKLSTGETEVLLTNLFDEKIYPLTIFKELYVMRWKIETAYGKQKNQMQMEIFSGHKVICIEQDYAATLFVGNLQSLVEKQSDVYLQALSEKRRHNYKINRNVSLAALKHKIVKLFLQQTSITILLQLQKAFERNVEPVRPNRQYKRTTKAKRVRGKYQTFTNYKRAI